MKADVKLLYDVAMGSYIDTFAENKRFFTQKEFEANYAKITALTYTKSKLDAIAIKLEAQEKESNKTK